LEVNEEGAVEGGSLTGAPSGTSPTVAVSQIKANKI
jgi:hypothetical protein